MKIARVLLMVLVVAMLAAGTILEKILPTFNLYGTWWFAALMALLGVGALVSLVQGKMWRKPPLLLVHASVVIILLGGALTTWAGKSGEIQIYPQQPCHTATTADGHPWTLPFDITLQQFDILYYEGTHTPMDFVSHVAVEGKRYDISMNHILRHRGYRLYQSNYDSDGSSILHVVHDPWGIGITYSGYILMVLGLLGLLVSPRGRYRRLWQGASVLLLLLVPSVSSAATPRTLPRDVAQQMGQIHVLYQGRVCPMQTLAKDFTTKLTGKPTYRGLTAEQVLSGYLFYFSDWADEPALKIKGAKALGVSKHSSINQLRFLDDVRQAPTTDKNLRAATEKYNLVRMLLSGRMLKMFPIEGDWYGQNDALPLTVADDEYLFVRRWQNFCQEQVALGDWTELSRIFSKTAQYQTQRIDISARKMHIERFYNGLSTGRWVAMLGIFLGLLCFAFALVRQNQGRDLPRWARVAGLAYVSLLTLYLLLVFVLRWVVGGHVPMAGGFDTMNLMAIVVGLFVLLFSRRSPMALPAGMLAMGFCQLVAMISGSNPPVTNLMPVLNSPLLSLHVATVMASYALLFFVMIFGVVGLITGRENVRRTILLVLYPAVTLLALGIAIGAVWAGVSWGNYWSWDPKEVWALITLILYAFALHPAVLRHPRAFYLYCTLAFFSVLITYFGVNLVLGGMHAYN